jgi:hypothetical protein
MSRPNQSGVSGDLHDQIVDGLAQNFGVAMPKYEPDDPGADLTIPDGKRLAVVEVKTGNPGLPLPSSTLARMSLLLSRVHSKLPQSEEVELLPVLVTNYRVSEADKQELEQAGVKLVHIERAVSDYDPKQFSLRFAEIVGVNLPKPEAVKTP